MISWLIFIGYIGAWLAVSSYAVRWIADNWCRCNGRSVDGKRRLMDGYRSSTGRGTCRDWHGEGCWRSDGEITPGRFVAGSLVSLAWPLMIPLFVSWSFANRKPTVIGLQKEIARLEREAGIR